MGCAKSQEDQTWGATPHPSTATWMFEQPVSPSCFGCLGPLQTSISKWQEQEDTTVPSPKALQRTPLHLCSQVWDEIREVSIFPPTKSQSHRVSDLGEPLLHPEGLSGFILA